MPRRRSRLSLHDEPFGSLMKAFNLLESQLTYALWLLVRTPTQTEIEVLLAQINSFDARVTLFSQLGYYRFKDKRSRNKIRSLTTRLRDINKRRNDLVHGTWKSIGNPAFVVKYQRQKPQISWKSLHVTPRSIRSDATRTWRAFIVIRKFCPVIATLNARDRKARERAASRKF
jgi:hypothetical protein